MTADIERVEAILPRAAVDLAPVHHTVGGAYTPYPSIVIPRSRSIGEAAGIDILAVAADANILPLVVACVPVRSGPQDNAAVGNPHQKCVPGTRQLAGAGVAHDDIIAIGHQT